MHAAAHGCTKIHEFLWSSVLAYSLGPRLYEITLRIMMLYEITLRIMMKTQGGLPTDVEELAEAVDEADAVAEAAPVPDPPPPAALVTTGVIGGTGVGGGEGGNVAETVDEGGGGERDCGCGLVADVLCTMQSLRCSLCKTALMEKTS